MIKVLTTGRMREIKRVINGGEANAAVLGGSVSTMTTTTLTPVHSFYFNQDTIFYLWNDMSQ